MMDSEVIGACRALCAMAEWRAIRAHLLGYAGQAAEAAVRAGRYDVIGLIDRYGAMKHETRKRETAGPA